VPQTAVMQNEGGRFVWVAGGDGKAMPRPIRAGSWLGADWGDRLCFASDYFEQMYDWAVDLIRKSKAFVCDLSAEELSATRGTLTSPGTDSPIGGRRDAVGRELGLVVHRGKRVEAQHGVDGRHGQGDVGHVGGAGPAVDVGVRGREDPSEGDGIAPVEVDEGAAFGAAILGGVAAEVWPDVPTAVAATVRPRAPVEPVSAWVERYREQRERFRALYPALRGIR